MNGDACAKGHAICTGPYVIAKVYGHGYQHGWSPQSQADADLIATAPDLLQLVREGLQAVKQLRGDLRHTKGHVIDLRDWEKSARAAIAKAEGR